MRRLMPAALVVLAACSGRPGAPQTEPANDAAEAFQLLQELIRFDTTNPPPPGSGKANADETALLKHVQRILAADGIESEIHEPLPGRGNLVARYRGSGARKPLLLMAHVDVVGVDPSQWDVDPFAGEIKDGYLWGRGALDDKDDAAVFVQVMRILARTKPALSRDVILMLNADEESSGTHGAAWMVKNRWDKIACEFVVSEGGTAQWRDGKVAMYGFQTAEKIYNDFRLYVRGESGHSSVPVPNNAIYGAARMLQKLESFRSPVRLIETTKASFKSLAGTSAWGANLMLLAAEGDLDAAEQLAENSRYNAQVRSTFVPTIIRGGIRENVLPPDVEINFNARLLPGEKIDDLVQALMAHLGIDRYDRIEGGEAAFEKWKREKKGSDVAVFMDDRGVDAPASSMDTDLYRALVRTAKKLSPDAIVSPRLATGATDLRFFRMKGVQAYGVSPCPVGELEEGTMHHHNERIRVGAVTEGVRFALELVREIAR